VINILSKRKVVGYPKGIDTGVIESGSQAKEVAYRPFLNKQDSELERHDTP
jgi:hypothetical protein